MFTIRKAIFFDIPELKTLYKETVLTVNRRDYSQEEVEDWASCGENDSRWVELLTTLYFVVAETPTGVIVGYSSIREDGYLHSMFVHKDFQGQGIATLLYRHIEEYARQKDILKIISEVSVTARPFFEQAGFKVDKEQKRKASHLCLVNYCMSKMLS